jgi:hypothetical protein
MEKKLVEMQTLGENICREPSLFSTLTRSMNANNVSRISNERRSANKTRRTRE